MPYKMQKTYATGIRKYKMSQQEFKTSDINNITYIISEHKKTVCNYEKYGFASADSMLNSINGVRVINGVATFEENQSRRWRDTFLPFFYLFLKKNF